MHGNFSHGSSAQRTWHCLVMSLAGLLLVLGAVGCASDHRISLHQLMEMEEEQRQAAASQPLPVGPPANQPAVERAIKEALGPYRAGRGDVLAVALNLVGEAAAIEPIQVRVDRNGKANLPLVGDLVLADLEIEDVERTIRAAYVPKFYRQASVHVEVVSAETRSILVVGAVTAPGMVQLRHTECDLLHAIVGAGGVSEVASGTVTLKRLRRSDEVTLNVLDREELKAALVLDPLEDGDIVTVHAATPNTVFVGGLVNAIGPQAYPSGVSMTILQAIAAAGGLRTDVTPREATLIRRLPDGDDVHVKLNLDRLTTGKDPNIKLAAGDILWVPDTFETRVQDWINRNVFFRVGGSVTANYNVTGVEYMNRASQQNEGGSGGAGTIGDRFDPFGSLNRNTALQALQAAPR